VYSNGENAFVLKNDRSCVWSCVLKLLNSRGHSWLFIATVQETPRAESMFSRSSEAKATYQRWEVRVCASKIIYFIRNDATVRADLVGHRSWIWTALYCAIIATNRAHQSRATGFSGGAVIPVMHAIAFVSFAGLKSAAFVCSQESPHRMIDFIINI
jgi:hypothetical protein